LDHPKPDQVERETISNPNPNVRLDWTPKSGSCTPEVNMDRIRIGCPAGYLQFFCIGIGFGYLFLKKNWIRTGSGYLFHFYNEIFL